MIKTRNVDLEGPNDPGNKFHDCSQWLVLSNKAVHAESNAGSRKQVATRQPGTKLLTQRKLIEAMMPQVFIRQKVIMSFHTNNKYKQDDITC